MTTTRVFLLATSLARLSEKERGGHRVRQGYFPDRPDRGTHVQVEEHKGHLILVTHEPDRSGQDTRDIPLSHAEALLDLAAGQVEYLSISLDTGNQRVAILRFISPGPLDLITMAFELDEQARRFQPPAWFGPEVTAKPSYQTRSIAMTGLPAAPEVEATNAALNSLLDTLDGRFGGQQHPQHGQAEQLIAPQRDVRREAELNSDDDGEPDDLAIEDSVIRELARSLRPRR